jgi:hypothetical protein
MILTSPLSPRKKALEGSFRGRSPTGKVSQMGKKEDSFDRGTEMEDGNKERRWRVGPRPKTDRSALEKEQEYAEESRKAMGIRYLPEA